MVIFQGDGSEGSPGPPGKQGDPGDRVRQTFHSCIRIADSVMMNSVVEKKTLIAHTSVKATHF